MKRRLCTVVVILTLLAAVFAIPAGAVTTESLETVNAFPPKRHFYSQLPEDAQLIYDALADEENLNAIKTGEPVVVASREIRFPTGISQAQYNDLYDDFAAGVDELGDIMSEVTNATAAFYRDRVEIFWTVGVRSRITYLKNGEAVSGDISLELGNTYTAQLQIILPLAEDWDGDAPTDRLLETDIERLADNVSTVVEDAEDILAQEGRAAAVTEINRLLCRYNAYNNAALEDDFTLRYPWTPLSALDQLIHTNDDSAPALKPVCEGYSKAFKLICDSLGLPCILVSGTGDGEDHMWNYVQMEDGVWYAVDATWNDSTGHDGYLLVGKDVMDSKHTTDCRFMQGEQMTFYYPVLASDSYEAPADGVMVTVEELAPIKVGQTVTADDTVPVIIKNGGEKRITVYGVTLEGSAFRLVNQKAAFVLEAGASSDRDGWGVAPAAALAVGICHGTVTVRYSIEGASNQIKTVSAPLLLTVLPADEPAPTPPDSGSEPPAVPDGEGSTPPEGDSTAPEKDFVGGALPEEKYEEVLSKIKHTLGVIRHSVKSNPILFVILAVLVLLPLLSFLFGKKK